MSEPVFDSETSENKGSGLRQWGRDWFFTSLGRKRSLNIALLKWAGVAVAAVLAVLQFTDNSTRPSPTVSVPSPVGVPKLGMSRDDHDFPMLNWMEPTEKAPIAKKTALSSRARVKLIGLQVIARPRNVSLIPPGSIVTAALVTGASNGAVKAKLEEPLVVNGETLLDSGSTVLGQGSSTDERLMVAFSKVVFPDGTFASIHGQACDLSDHTVGLKGEKLGNYAVQTAGAVGLGLVGGIAEGLQDVQGQQGVAVRPPSLRNALLHATANTALEQGRDMMSGLKDRKPVVAVAAGTRIEILLEGGR